MNRKEYLDWWVQVDDEFINSLPEPQKTLVLHVIALQERIDDLMDPDEHDQQHGKDCQCALVMCCCSYEHPDSVCLSHERRVIKCF